MSYLQTILMWFLLVAAGVLSVVGFAVWCDQHQVFPGRRLLGAFRRLPWPVQFFLLAFSLHLIVHGSIKTNAVGEVEGAAQQRGRGVRHASYGLQDDVQQRGRDIPVACDEAAATFFSRDRNVASPLYEIPQPEAGRVPAAAELSQNWWRRGCWEDWRTVTFEDGWVFPRGSNHFSQVVVMSQGEIRSSLRDEPIASFGTRVAHVPFDTCFYHEHTPSNSYRFVWDRAYTERNTNMPMTAAVELFRNGDTCVTTNGVSTVMPYEIPFPHVGIGQDDDWVRANFTNATDILAVGYADWVDAQVGVNLENGLYKFTATFPDDPPEATELIVGDLSVCVTNAGEYVFVLEKGVEYSFGTNPYDHTVEYSMQDDLMEAPVFANGWWDDDNGVWTVDGGELQLVYPTFASAGRIWWMPTFCGSPDVAHLGPYSGAKTFTAQLSDYRYAEAVAYHWTCEDENVVIVSPNSRETTITFATMPSWRAATLTVTATVGTNELRSVLAGFTYGTNDTPQVHFSFSVPDAVLLNSNNVDNAKLRKMSLSFSSDVETNGSIRLSCASGADRISVWGFSNRTSRVSLPQVWEAADFAGFEAFVEGVAASESVDDVRLKAEFIPDEGETDEIVRNLTVVEVGDISLPGAPDDGLVVTRGSSVLLKVDCLPAGAESFVSTLWESRRLRLDLTTYDDWTYATSASGDNEATYAPSEGGIYQLRVKAGVGGGDGVDERCFRWGNAEPVSTGYKRRGDLKSFGVVSHVWQKTLRDCACGFLGSTDYLATADLPGQYGFPSCSSGRHKCNFFVAHRIVQAGLICPGMHGFTNSYPPVANDWGIATREIEGWEPLTADCYPEPGFVIGEPDFAGDDPHGHVAILDFDGCGINAGTLNVNRKFMPRIEVFCIKKLED